MEVIVHGTKGGYKVLYQTENVPFSIARDVRRIDRNDGNPVGQFAYSISFAEGGCVFTKYIIVRDTERAAIGNIAFSMYLHNSKKLPGKDVKNLLDDLAEKYRNDYIIGGNLGNKQEDWAFVRALVDAYKKKGNPDSSGDSENFIQGTAEAAYVYFSSEEELQKYFDWPDQDAYHLFKQVFFVNADLQDNPENPLNALRHDHTKDLTGRIDLDNTKYKLKEFHGNGKNGITIQIWANDKKITNNDNVYKKDNIRIMYSKNAYFIPIDETGKLTDDNIKRYLEVSDNKIKVINNVLLSEKERIVVFQVKDMSSNLITDAEIICNKATSNEKKEVVDNQIKFKGEEIKNEWIVYGKKDDLISINTTFIPEQVKNQLIIQLKKQNNEPNIGNQNNNASESNIEAKDKKRIRRANTTLVALGFTGLFVIGIIAVLVYSSISGSSNKITLDDIERIKDYANGAELYKDKLDSIKIKYCPSRAGSNEKTGLTRIWNALFSSSKDMENKKASNTNNMEYCQIIENALKIRIAINEGKLDSLKKIHYSDLPDALKTSLDSLSNTDIESKQNIGSKLKSYNPSKMDLNQVANFINIELDAMKHKKESATGLSVKKADNSKNDNNTSKSAGHSTSNGNSNSQANNSINQSLMPIDEAAFWELVKQDNVSYDSFVQLFKGKTSIANNDYVGFYNRYLGDSEKFKKFKAIDLKVREKASNNKDLQTLKNNYK